MAKLREGWKSHGRFWRYMENPLGFSTESVVQFTEHGLIRYEARYKVNGCCGFARSYSDFCRTRKFDSKEDAFVFCEEMHRQYIANQ